MKKLTYLFFIFLTISVFSQQPNVKKDSIEYKNTVVKYVILSKRGEEKKRKPLFIFCQGSLARPLKILADDASYPFLPFSEEILLQKYHIIIISKPGIPLEVNVKDLKRDYTYPKTGLPSQEYILNNSLEYYYKRNNFLLKKLIKEPWVDSKTIVAAGHSEGSYIALKMAENNRKITHLIYSGGNPLGRMMSIINQDRKNPKEKESSVVNDIEFWKKVVKNKNYRETNQENTSFYEYSLSQNFTKPLLDLKIPVLVTYGTRDQNGQS